MNTATADQPRALDFATARRAMIDSQLRTSGVNDIPVLRRMAAVPREDFVPVAVRGMAYIDRAIPLGVGRMLPSPVFHGMMLQEAQPRPDDMVLIVDSGSGYLPALVEPMVKSIAVIGADEAVNGASDGEGYSLLLIDGAAESLPLPLIERLADDARVVAGVVEDGVTRLAAGRKAGERVALAATLDLGIPRMAQFDSKREWRF